ncbi:hypothetical protein ACWKWP_04760 [Agromyces soli]
MTARAPLPRTLAGVPFATRVALENEVSPKRLRAHDLAAPTSGARMPRGAEDSARRRAVLLALREDAFLCGASAAQEHRLPLPWRLRHVVEVGVPWPARAARRSGILARTLRLGEDDVLTRGGIRVTTPERTFCDLATRLTVPELVAVADVLPSADRLAVTVAAYPDHRQRSKLDAALALRDPRRESPKESEMIALVLLAGLPAPVPQAVILEGRHFVARVDAFFAEFGEVLEYQGDHHRSDLGQWRRDRTREAELESLGLHVTEVTQGDLDDARRFIARLAANLHRRGWAGAPRDSRWFPSRE